MTKAKDKKAWQVLDDWTVDGTRDEAINAALPEWSNPKGWKVALSSWLFANQDEAEKVIKHKLHASWFMAVIALAKTGLQCGGKHAYLEVKNKKTGDRTYTPATVQHMITKDGMIELAYRSGNITSIYSENVYDCDTFRVLAGSTPKIIHEQKGGERTPDTFVACYAVAHLKNGGRVQRVVWPEEVGEAKGASKKSDESYSPWQKHPGAMTRKTAIRRLYEMLPMSAEMEAAVAYNAPTNKEDYIDTADYQDTAAIQRSIADRAMSHEDDEAPAGELPTVDDAAGEEV
jgi:recombination protein RecT